MKYFFQKYTLKFCLVCLLLLLSTPCLAATHHVTSITQANSVGSPGDVIYIKAGTYSATLRPRTSGTSGNPITFKAEGGEVVLKNSSGSAINLQSRNYIVIDGLKILDTDGPWIIMNSGGPSYNVIKNCYLEKALDWTGVDLNGGHHNKFLNNIFKSECACSSVCSDVGGPSDLMKVSNSGYNLFDGNEFHGGTHNAIAFQDQGPDGSTSYNIIRNNLFQNKWHSNFGAMGVEYILIENNLVLDGGKNYAVNWCGSERDRTMSRDKHKGINTNTHFAIVRRNTIVNNGHGFGLNSAISDTKYPWKNNCVDNRYYNNTLADNQVGVRAVSTDPTRDNIIKNNIIYNSVGNNVFITNNTTTPSLNYFIRNNIFGESGSVVSYASNDKRINQLAVNPRFVNASARNYNLNAGSPMINAGAWLTTTTSGGSGNKIPVEDSRYFMDGWGVIDGDLIQFEGESTPVRITKVDYSNNILTLSKSISYAKGQGIALPYYGSAPDIGALEYGEAEDTTPIPPVDNFRIVNKN